MDQTTAYLPTGVAGLSVDARAAFIIRTYNHLYRAIMVFASVALMFRCVLRLFMGGR